MPPIVYMNMFVNCFLWLLRSIECFSIGIGFPSGNNCILRSAKSIQIIISKKLNIICFVHGHRAILFIKRML